MKKVLKIVGIGFGALVVLIAGLLYFNGILPIGFGMHDEVANMDGVAIQGYDPVEYFVSGKPTKGKEEFTAQWKGVDWRFSSEENKKKFEEKPDFFEPQFGGHCGFAVSTGFAVEGDPTSFLIKENKLYILSNPEVLQEFIDGGDELITTCNANWK